MPVVNKEKSQLGTMPNLAAVTKAKQAMVVALAHLKTGQPQGNHALCAVEVKVCGGASTTHF